MTAEDSTGNPDIVSRETAESYAISEESLVAQFFLLGTKESRKYFYPVLAVAGVLVFASMELVGSYMQQTVYFLLMYIALVSIWNFFCGYSGYIIFGVTIFFGIGGYATAGIVKAFGVDWYVALLAAALLTGVVAVLLGFVLLRLSGIYFGIGTFLILEGLREGLYFERHVTGFLGGSSGITMPPIDSTTTFVAFAFMALLTVTLTYEMATSKFGLRLMAIREDEAALTSLGVNPLKYKLTAFVIAAVVMAALGSLYGLTLGFLYPETPFNFQLLSTVILAAVLGGRGTIVGPIIGVVLLYSLEEALWLNYPNLFLIIYGIALVVIVLLLPEGIINRLKKSGILPDERSI